MSSNLIASFTMPAGYVGTPRVTVISAAREVLLGDELNHTPALRASDKSTHPMFYSQPAITRVDARYPDPDHVALTIVGHGFDIDPGTTLLIGHTGYNGVARAVNQYAMPVPGMVLNVRVPRSDLFPHAVIDYITTDGNQSVDFAFPRDDDGPPKILECSGKAAGPSSGKQTVAFTIKGDYFVAGALPKPSLGDNLNTTFKSPQEWDFNATLPRATKQIDVSITQGKDGPITRSCPIN